MANAIGLLDGAMRKNSPAGAAGARRHAADKGYNARRCTAPAPAIITGSDLLATLMEGMVRASGLAGALAVLPLPDLELAPFVLHWHRRNDAHPAQRWLREQIALVCRELYGIGDAQ